LEEKEGNIVVIGLIWVMAQIVEIRGEEN